MPSWVIEPVTPSNRSIQSHYLTLLNCKCWTVLPIVNVFFFCFFYSTLCNRLILAAGAAGRQYFTELLDRASFKICHWSWKQILKLFTVYFKRHDIRVQRWRAETGETCPLKPMGGWIPRPLSVHQGCLSSSSVVGHIIRPPHKRGCWDTAGLFRSSHLLHTSPGGQSGSHP